MKKARQKKIAVKVTAQIVIGLVLIFTALTAIIAVSITKDLVRREQDKLTLLATENAGVAREFMESMLDKQSVIISTVQNLNNVADDQKIATLSGVISEIKKAEDHALSLFFVAEPNTFFQNSPNGYSIVATSVGSSVNANMYQNINKESYLAAKAGKKMIVADPFDMTIDGKHYKVISVMLPILNGQGNVVGMVGSNIDTALLNGADYNSGGYGSFATQIICGHQTVITNSKNPDQIGQKYLDVSDSQNAQKILDSTSEVLTFMDTNTSGVKYYKSYIPFYIKGSSVVWLSGTSITKAEFDAQIWKQILTIGLFLVIALVLLAVFVYTRINKELRPIKKLEQAVKELSNGNLNYELDFASDDELGNLAHNLRKSAKILYSYVADIDFVMGQMAEGNFDLAPSQPFIGDFQNIEHSIEKFVFKISDTIYKIRIAAVQVSSNSDQVSNGAQDLAQSSAEQAGSVEELSSLISQVSTHTQSSAADADHVSQLSTLVSGHLSSCNAQMSEMIGAISEISASSEQINKIIKTIEDIAFQTNILALNAAVEAARAGSAGKGFAVVADEVRNLATKSSQAAKQTSALIEGSTKSVENGVRIANGTAKSLDEVVIDATEITKLITQIAAATAEQSNSIVQINMGINKISSLVQTNSATSEESAAASEELQSQANLLESSVSQFKLMSEEKPPAPAKEKNVLDVTEPPLPYAENLLSKY